MFCIESHGEEKVNITKVSLNGTTLTAQGGGVYSGTVPSGINYLQVSIFSDDYKKLTEYHMQASISFTYPQTVGPFMNITPIYADGEKHFLANIGSIRYNSTDLTYHTKDYYQNGGYLFNHGGYFTAFGGSATSQTINTDLTYQFNTNPSYIGLYFECVNGQNTSPIVFPTSQRTVTVSINYLDATEKAIIENAESTKNIFEWLTDGFVGLIVPTSDGIEEMLNETSSILETRLGILYLPIDVMANLLAVLTSTLEGEVTGELITVPQWDISLFGHTFTMWDQTNFSMSDNAIFHYIIYDLGLIYLVRIGYFMAMITSIIQTINTLTDNMLNEEFAYFVTDIEPISGDDDAYAHFIANYRDIGRDDL